MADKGKLPQKMLQNQSVGNNELHQEVAGDGIQGAGGNPLSIQVPATADGAAVQVGVSGLSIDGDKINIDFTPSNYTPDATPAEADDVDDMAAHLKGIDTALAAGSKPVRFFIVGELAQKVFTFDQDVSSPFRIYVDGIAYTPEENMLTVSGAGNRTFTLDRGVFKDGLPKAGLRVLLEAYPG